MTTRLRSPLPWMGGKFYSAPHIVEAFPEPGTYDVYVDLFGGAAHVLLQKPPSKQVEVYNDINHDLVNFWMCARDHAPALEERCRSLPYSRELFYRYHKSLYASDVQLEPVERAARWFYVLRSSFNAHMGPVTHGWLASAKCEAIAYHTALDLFGILQRRMRYVLIDCRDFAEVFRSYNRPRVLFYGDPPYFDVEGYYQHPFTLEDHKRLATLLNTTSAYVALSYYPHPLLETLYPAQMWRRVTLEVPKHSQRTAETRERATEMLLCNYPAPALSLWEERDTQPQEG